MSTAAARPRRRRLFAALVPAAAVREQLARAAAGLGHRGVAVPPANLHLTLAFLGAVAEDRVAVAAAALETGAGFPPFTLRLERVGHWRRAGVLWCAPRETPPELTALAGALHAALRGAGFELEARPFAAHLTLARKVSHYRGQDHLPQPVSWPVAEARLMASRTLPGGATYHTVRAVALQAASSPVG